MNIAPLNIGTIHLIGIGGIGMSGIAEILHSLGHVVQGSDMSDNANIKRLRDKGIKVFTQHEASNVEGSTLVVPSSAILGENPEIIAARKQGIPVIPRSEMLGELMRFKPAIAVAGTHGKTTTTSLVSTLLNAGGLDPTIINGGIINALKTNARVGKGEWMVVEADESDGTFVKVPSTVAIVTNIEPEHLDHYGSFEKLKEAFDQFVKQIPFYGFSVLCSDHPEVQKLLPHITERRFITYGFQEGAMCRAINVSHTPKGMQFDVSFDNGQEQHTLKDVLLPMHGDHNVLNALAAISVALKLSISEENIKKGLGDFCGVKRRFTHAGTYKGATIIDDYAHHPTEIGVVLKAAKKVASNKVVAVVQPDRFSRLQSLFEEFSECMNDADHIVILPVHAAGETPVMGIDHIALAQAVRSKTNATVETIETPEELAAHLEPLCQEGTYIICMGAGSITQIAHGLQKNLEDLPS